MQNIQQVSPVNTAPITPFDFNGNEVRTLLIEGEPWFVLKDVCEVLGITNPWNVASRLNDDEKNTLYLARGNRGNPNVTVVNEPGLYSVIFRSDKSQAKEFQRWVMREVLPAIRKTGSYSVTPVSPVQELTRRQILEMALEAETRSEQLARELSQTQQELEEIKPDAEFLREFLDRVEAVTLQQAGQIFGVSANKIFELLRQDGFLHDGKKGWREHHNLPTAKGKASGMFTVKTKTYTKNGKECIAQRTFLTAKGLQEVHRMYFRGTLAVVTMPVIEPAYYAASRA